MDSDLSFFKVISSSEKMKIPPAVVSRMGGALDKRYVLRDEDSNVWPVDVATQGDDSCFREGWAKLYTEKSLEQGDFLVFDYRGRNFFDITLFGSNACRKGKLGADESRVDENDVDNDVQQEVDDEEEEDDDDDDDDEEEDENYVPEEEQVNISKLMSMPEPNEYTTIGDEDIPSKTINEKQKAHNYFGADIFKSGLAPRPDNPYFVSRSGTRIRKNELFIPKSVRKDYQLNLPEKLFLVDEHGRKWKATIKKWKDGRLWCTKGWGSLRRANNIEDDDNCICEFVEEDGCKDMFMRVRVVRGR